jgi:hypothetical protein
MELDSRYRWLFPVKDVHGRDVTLGIGLENGRVIISLGLGWCEVEDPALVDEIGYSFTTASYVARELRRKEPPIDGEADPQ